MREDFIETKTSNLIVGNNIINKEIERTSKSNCITGDRDFLIEHLKKAFKVAEKIDIIVAFLMESGVSILIDDLKDAIGRNTRIRILTGNYLNITQPQALYMLRDALGNKVDLRFYDVPNRSFHPKAYIFQHQDTGEMFIGSSNISKSALTYGIEWNYHINKESNKEDFVYALRIFEDLFNNHSIVVDEDEMRSYSKRWKSNKLFVDLERQEELENQNVINMVRPKGAQIEALYELKKTRQEGEKKGLVIAATGVGKTYLAAFDSLEFDRVLFIAHREEILLQARDTFSKVRNNKSIGFFVGNKKELNCDMTLATVQTLGQTEYLCEKYFKKDDFEYIVVDEFHHAVADSYQRIIEYFNPKFLLGLTATPDRLDNKEVAVICNSNVVYEVNLKTAINKGWLVPFRYYGVYDETDYEEIEYKDGRYNEQQLENALLIQKRLFLILSHYKKYSSKRALGFCSTRLHAEEMAKYFCENGVKACAVYSGINGAYSMDRNLAVAKLQKGEIKIIFSVDMFNEGLDIPSVDMVLFLRPTESPTIFLQQLGRGLRNSKDKRYLNVLDFIGNYKRANLIPFLLTGEYRKLNERIRNYIVPREEELPEDCRIDFDLRLIDLFEKMAKERQNILDLIIDEYNRIKNKLGRRPLREDMYIYMDDYLHEKVRRSTTFNIFKNYIEFLESIDELEEEEKDLLDTEAFKFINFLETTRMTKSYKLPVFLAFFNNGQFKLRIDEECIYKSFLYFYSSDIHCIDLLKDERTSNYVRWSKKEYKNLANDGPLSHLSDEYFYADPKEFCIENKIEPFIKNNSFLRHYLDTVAYREREYFKDFSDEKLRDELAEVRFAFRDEKVNIFAMTRGGVKGNQSHQILLCKKKPINDDRRLFLLDAKKSNSEYGLSEAGDAYFTDHCESQYNLNFVARIDSQIKVKVCYELFEAIASAGYFSLWQASAPIEYFNGAEEGYLVLFRVYKLSEAVKEELLEQGRSGRNYLYGLSEPAFVEINKPVLDQAVFNKTKLQLIKLLQENGWLLGIK